MRSRRPLILTALLLAAALTLLTPLSPATGTTPTTAAKKKKKKKSAKCKKGYVKKTVDKTVRKKGKKKTVKVKKCVKKKAPAKKPVSRPAPTTPAPTPPQPVNPAGTYIGTTSQGQEIAVTKSRQGSVSAQATLIVNCTGGDAPGDATYSGTGNNIGKIDDPEVVVSIFASSAPRPPLRALVRGTIANGTTMTGTIDPGDNAQCPDTGAVLTFQATKK